jgi:hypothetical protein
MAAFQKQVVLLREGGNHAEQQVRRAEVRVRIES